MNFFQGAPPNYDIDRYSLTLYNTYIVKRLNTVGIREFLRDPFVRRSNISALGLSALVLATGAPSVRKRLELPEPLNFAQHVGNTPMSAWLGIMAGDLIAQSTQSGHLARFGMSRHATRGVMAAAGFAVGAGLNFFAETRFGIRISGWNNTPDMIDFGYGVAAATIAGTLAAPLPETTLTESPTVHHPSGM